MKVAVFSTKKYDRLFFEEANQNYGNEFVYLEPRLTASTCRLGFGFEVICAFVNDQLDEGVLKQLASHGTRLIVLRCAGFNNVNLKVAGELGITILRVPAYSPHGVAEHAIGLILSLNRKIYRSHNRIREGNFSLDGLLGFELYHKKVGILGTGKIGCNVARIMKGFGAHVLAYDVQQNPECVEMGVDYHSLDEVFAESDIISLHLPLMPATYHIINKEAIAKMKQGVMLINTSRGGLIDTAAVIEALKLGQVGYLGLDVYEEEEDLFFEDQSDHVIQDDIFARLLTFPNVVITGHQAFFTDTALHNIVLTTMDNIKSFQEDNINPKNLVTYKS